jgi:hypothetical protein
MIQGELGTTLCVATASPADKPGGGWPPALRRYLRERANQENELTSDRTHRSTAWGVQRGRRRLQATHPATGASLKLP